jgi:hypothetical protein
VNKAKSWQETRIEELEEMRKKGIGLQEIYQYDAEVYGSPMASMTYLVQYANLSLREAKELHLEQEYGHKVSLEEHQESLIKPLEEISKLLATEDNNRTD